MLRQVRTSLFSFPPRWCFRPYGWNLASRFLRQFLPFIPHFCPNGRLADLPLSPKRNSQLIVPPCQGAVFHVYTRF